jgi:hypothetical protein
MGRVAIGRTGGSLSVYRGRHRKHGSTSSLRRVGPEIVAGLVLVAALTSTTALAAGRPKECTGTPPTAITIQQTLLTPDPGGSVSFTYRVSPGSVFDAGAVVASTTLLVGSGQTLSTVMNGFSKGSYTVRQEPDPTSGIAPAPDQSVAISPPACVATVAFTSIVEPS